MAIKEKGRRNFVGKSKNSNMTGREGKPKEIAKEREDGKNIAAEFLKDCSSIQLYVSSQLEQKCFIRIASVEKNSLAKAIAENPDSLFYIPEEIVNAEAFVIDRKGKITRKFTNHAFQEYIFQREENPDKENQVPNLSYTDRKISDPDHTLCHELFDCLAPQKEEQSIHVLGPRVSAWEILDITDLPLNGRYEGTQFGKGARIQQRDILHDGLFCGYGYRVISLGVDDQTYKLLGLHKGVQVSAYWKDEPQEDLDSQNIIEQFFCAGRQNFCSYRKYSAVLDTNIDLAEPEETKKLVVELQIQRSATKVSFGLELDVQVRKPKGCDRPVYIDFGTSSTCIAMPKEEIGYRLLNISDDPNASADNRFENSSDVLLASWPSFSKQWAKIQSGEPGVYLQQFHSNDLRLDEGESPWQQQQRWQNRHISYGSYLSELKEKLLESPKNTDENTKAIKEGGWAIKLIEAYMSELKTIARHSTEGRKPIEVRPLIEDEAGERPPKRIGPDCDLEPIVLYAYILGTKINHLYSPKLYTQFCMTMPVKFSHATKEAISQSFKTGLAYALPQELRKKVSVSFWYSEPAAIARGLIDHTLGQGGPKFNIDVSKKEQKLFAIYDFGGGTLDYCLGLLRAARPEDKVRSPEKIKMVQGYRILEILSDGGELDDGGEKLLEVLTHIFTLEVWDWLYDNGIDMRLPDQSLEHYHTAVKSGGKHYDFYYDVLNNKNHSALSSGEYADSNFRLLKEQFARPFFYDNCESTNLSNILSGISLASSSNNRAIDLGKPDGEFATRLKQLEEEGGSANIRRHLINYIRDKAVLPFFDQFLANEEPVQKRQGPLYLFMAGNVCKSTIVQDLFDQERKKLDYPVQIHNLAQDPIDPYEMNCKTIVVSGAAAEIPDLYELGFTEGSNRVLFRFSIYAKGERILQATRAQDKWYRCGHYGNLGEFLNDLKIESLNRKYRLSDRLSDEAREQLRKVFGAMDDRGICSFYIRPVTDVSQAMLEFAAFPFASEEDIIIYSPEEVDERAAYKEKIIL